MVSIGFIINISVLVTTMKFRIENHALGCRLLLPHLEWRLVTVNTGLLDTEWCCNYCGNTGELVTKYDKMVSGDDYDVVL
jgi:hypothetical protein